MFNKICGKSQYILASVTAFVSQSLHDSNPKYSLREEELNCIDLKKKRIVKRCQSLIQKKLTEIGAPGIIVGVSVNGKNMWEQGFGYSDVENEVLCKPSTVMRIASISKSLTMIAVGKLIENDKLSLDAEIQTYVPDFPYKFIENKKVTITLRLLLSHTSGIRHYMKKEEDSHDEKPANTDDATTKDEEESKSKRKSSCSEFDNLEYYSMKSYKSVTEALDMFKNDSLFHTPGEKFLYTTHGFTLVSAAVEKASGEEFIPHMNKLFHQLGMHNTHAENPLNIVYDRARHYTRNDKGRLVNVPYVDNSYKWAGGGFISNVIDLLKFANVMLYSFQCNQNSKSYPGFLDSETVKMMWTPVIKPEQKTNTALRTNAHYGLGWSVYPEEQEYGYANKYDFEISHTGGAIGASSILYIHPLEIDSKHTKFHSSDKDADNRESQKDDLISVVQGVKTTTSPHGIAVVVLTNLQGVNLTGIARSIAKEFKPLATML